VGSAAQEIAAPPNPPRKRRRKKKRARAEGPSEKVASAKNAAPAPASGLQAAACFVVSLASAVYYVWVQPNDPSRPFVLLAVGLFAFLCGASRGLDPERTVGAFAAMVAVGLAIIGIRPSEIGTVLAMAGGLGLGGAIHRLGRLGPDAGPAQKVESG